MAGEGGTAFGDGFTDKHARHCSTFGPLTRVHRGHAQSPGGADMAVGARAGATAAFAADGAQCKPSDEKAAKAPCGCAIKDNAKVCGVDKDCCCTGEKASKTSAKTTTPAGK